MNATQNSLEVANTISQQIGHRAFVMMGTTTKLGDEKSLLFNIRGSRNFNKCRVSLELNDTYTVTFYLIRGINIKAEKSVEMVYADSLKNVIESATGLYLSL